jgi:Flp pilus assembly protein TadD/thiol-disulfide isomerase/thioredoxin
VSQSPQKLAASKLYRDGWRAVNTLIRSDGSWSGRERKNCYRNLGNGKFEDVSFLSGLDLPDDGRSWVTLDIDSDGALDLVMSFRTGPRVRVFRNMGGGRARVFQLEGKGDAIGARVTAITGRRRLHRSVRGSSGFASQPSRRVHFGLTAGETIRSIEVVWPGGAKQSFTAMPETGVVRLAQGGPASALATHKPEALGPAAMPAELPFPWLVEPVPAPGKFTGRTLLAFYADWCPPCRAERAELTAANARLTAGGVRVRFVNVDDPKEQHTVAAFSLLHRNLFDRRVDPALPSSFLIEDGKVAKVYKGAVTPVQLLADAADRTRQAFPFDGQWYGPRPARNWVDLATDLAEHGLTAEAEPLMAAAIQSGSSDPQLLNNFAALLFESGKLERAEALLRQSLAAQPDQTEALANLGAVELRLERPKDAVRTLERAMLLQPDDPFVQNALGSAWFAAGDAAKAESFYAEASRLEPANADYRYNLATALTQTGKLREALAAFEQVHKQRGDSVDLLNDLGILYMETGQTARGIAAFERSLKLDPNHAATRANLQRARSLAR